MYEIDKNVPIAAHRSKYPFSEMEVGDSFSFPVEEIVRIRGSAARFGDYHEKRFSTKTIDDQTARCWRIS